MALPRANTILIEEDALPTDLESSAAAAKVNGINTGSDDSYVNEKADANEAKEVPNIKSYAMESKSKTLDAKGWMLASLTFQAIGVVYGDIGTSPLYVLNGIFSSTDPAPSEEDVIGIISTIVWFFTIVVIVKYALIVLQFGTGLGEGGTFALYQSLFPKALNDDIRDDTTYAVAAATKSIGGLAAASERAERRAKLLRYSWIKPVLCAWALFGSGLTIADGILTPAVSVVSAAEGIAVVDPSQGNNIRPIAIAILIALILAQSFGIKKLAVVYSPLVLLWFLFLFLTGAYNCHLHPGIWRAWDPSRAVLYFTRTGNYQALSGVLLAMTGCEALFANLGQLGQRAIQLPLIFVVYPSLMLAYLGQGAQLIVNGPAVVPNIFYLSIPGGTGGGIYWIGFATGLLATIIASQAMLTACFSIVSQLVHMKSFPSVKQKFPSDDYGQAYIPVINYSIGAAIIAVVGGFGTSTHLINAYGFAVAAVMIVTTTEIALCIYFVKRLPIVLGVLFFGFFGFVDCLLWGSTFHKVPEGAWFSLGVGIILATFMCMWTWLSGLIEAYDRENRLVLNQLIEEVKSDDSTEKDDFKHDLQLHGIDGLIKPLPRSDMVAVFWKPSSGNGVPHSFSHFLTKYPSCPSIVIFLSVKMLAVPSIPTEQSVVVRKVRRYPGFYTATLRQGYKDHLRLEALNYQLMQQIESLERIASTSQQQLKSVLKGLEESQKTVTHIYPSYYPAAETHPKSIRSVTDANKWKLIWHPINFWFTCVDLSRVFLIEVLYRRLKGAFAEEDGPFDAREEVIRVVVTAIV